ncbi:PEP-CTERM sorting domain-containing protein [Pontiellaceae bacterium B12219]|nr:PEP-CTERM sorting domain-containing protein [Pontiellaceae bacterium B12219]
MKRTITTLSAVFLTAGLAQAALYINAGSSPTAGVGPDGANANYLAYQTPSEQPTTGELQTYNGISFAEGGLAGTYNVGIEFTWTTNGVGAANSVKQAFSRSQNPGSGYSSFYQDWVGMDVRTSEGGIGAGTTMTLTLTGLEANQDFTLTSYHFDPHDQSSTFTTSASGATVYASEDADGVYVDPSPFAYDFDLTSDGSGTATIDYVNVNGSWLALNGFDLQAVPEPATLGMVALFGGGILFIRRRFMI